MAPVMTVTGEIVIVDQEELRKANLRVHIKDYQEQSYRALANRFAAPPFSEAQSAANKDYMFAMGSIARLEELLGEDNA